MGELSDKDQVMKSLDEENIITDEIKQLIGKDLVKPATLTIENGMVRKFVQATGDSNPLWQDENYAKKTKYGSTIVPPTFLTFTAFWPEEIQYRLAKLDAPVKRIMAGGVEYEYFKEVKPGDMVTATAVLSDAYVRQGKEGKLLFITVEITYVNQKREVAVRERNTVIRY
jgi:acyl dehydratase